MKLFTRSRTLQVVVATRASGVLAALTQAAQHLSAVQLEQREALSVQGAYQNLRGAHLVIVDLADLVGADEARAQLQAALTAARLTVVSGVAFVQEPQRYLEQAVAASGLGAMLPPRQVVFTSYAGGVGKTTLALAAAQAFHAATRLPAVVIELSPTASGLYAVGTDPAAPTLYEVMEQGAAFPRREGVLLAGMDWELARLLPTPRLVDAWRELVAGHIFTPSMPRLGTRCSHNCRPKRCITPSPTPAPTPCKARRRSWRSWTGGGSPARCYSIAAVGPRASGCLLKRRSKSRYCGNPYAPAQRCSKPFIQAGKAKTHEYPLYLD